MGENGCFGEGSTPAESPGIRRPDGTIIFENEFGPLHLTVDLLSHLVHYTRSPAAASPASSFFAPDHPPLFLACFYCRLAVFFSPSLWESLTTGRRWGLACWPVFAPAASFPPPGASLLLRRRSFAFRSFDRRSQACRVTPRRHFKHCLSLRCAFGMGLTLPKRGPQGP